MRCPFCGHQEDKVVDSRSSKEGRAVRRRRECLKCEKRYTTYEYIENVALSVVAPAGLKVTGKSTDAPAANVSGKRTALVAMANAPLPLYQSSVTGGLTMDCHVNRLSSKETVL